MTNDEESILAEIEKSDAEYARVMAEKYAKSKKLASNRISSKKARSTPQGREKRREERRRTAENKKKRDFLAIQKKVAQGGDISETTAQSTETEEQKSQEAREARDEKRKSELSDRGISEAEQEKIIHLRELHLNAQNAYYQRNRIEILEKSRKKYYLSRMEEIARAKQLRSHTGKD